MAGARQHKHSAEWQRPPAEVLYATELAALRKDDRFPKPPGWQLSLKAVLRFIVGDKDMPSKVVCSPALIERAMVTLATSRALLLIGEPGTAKSLLSELLAAAISGDSTLTIHFYRTRLRPTLRRIDAYVIRWARRKYKRMVHQTKGGRDWFDRLRRKMPRLFAHWPLCHGNG